MLFSPLCSYEDCTHSLITQIIIIKKTLFAITQTVMIRPKLKEKTAYNS